MTTRRLSILSIGGHPKDVVLYAGGTMALHVERGDRVVGLTPTYGLSQHYGPNSPLQRKLAEVLDGSIGGIHCRVPYAETFLPLNANVYRSLPFSDHEFEIAERSGDENLANFTQMLLDDFKPE